MAPRSRRPSTGSDGVGGAAATDLDGPDRTTRWAAVVGAVALVGVASAGAPAPALVVGLAALATAATVVGVGGVRLG
jgi:hypothetical protein